MINAENYKKELLVVLFKYGFSAQNIVFVDDLADGRGSPFRIARAVEKDGHVVILIKACFSRDDMDSVIGGMLGFPDSLTKPLGEDVGLFLRHTILHEISEILNRDFSEQENDKWAFKELGC